MSVTHLCMCLRVHVHAICARVCVGECMCMYTGKRGPFVSKKDPINNAGCFE